MKIDEKKIGSTYVITLIEPQLTTENSAIFKGKILEFVSEGKNKIVLNFSNVTFIDSSGLGCLIPINKAMNQPGKYFALCNLLKDVSKAFELTRLNTLFHIFPTEDEAVLASNK